MALLLLSFVLPPSAGYAAAQPDAGAAIGGAHAGHHGGACDSADCEPQQTLHCCSIFAGLCQAWPGLLSAGEEPPVLSVATSDFPTGAVRMGGRLPEAETPPPRA